MVALDHTLLCDCAVVTIFEEATLSTLDGPSCDLVRPVMVCPTKSVVLLIVTFSTVNNPVHVGLTDDQFELICN